MRCPKCGTQEDRVIDSRSSKDGASIRRRRECTGCQFRFTTYEEIERETLRIVKRDGRAEPFERRKLINGMLKACEKRPILLADIERVAGEIESELGAEREVPSHWIGAKVMEKLHALDQVAYVRYASVYRQFQDIDAFLNEIQNMGRKVKASALQSELFK